jgi:hypothetical protein
VTLLVLGLLLAVVIFGGRRLGAGVRGVMKVWRPTAGLAAVAVLIGALALVVREDWLPAAGLAVTGLGLAFSARRRRRLDNQAQTQTAAPAAPVQMSPADARAILGVEPGASTEAVQAAYRRLIRMAHPDQGGTRGLAAQLNLARDVLIGR